MADVLSENQTWKWANMTRILGKNHLLFILADWQVWFSCNKSLIYLPWKNGKYFNFLDTALL